MTFPEPPNTSGSEPEEGSQVPEEHESSPDLGKDEAAVGSESGSPEQNDGPPEFDGLEKEIDDSLKSIQGSPEDNEKFMGSITLPLRKAHALINIQIRPKNQNLSDLDAEDSVSKYMPEEYVKRLGDSKIVTINHLQPSLARKTTWPEKKRPIILIGVRGEVPREHRDPEKPLLDAAPKDTVRLGHDLHQSLGLSRGDKLTLMGEEFTIHKYYKSRNKEDDISIWVDLAMAQKMLSSEGQIDEILALGCRTTPDRLSLISGEIAGILPGTQVIEFVTGEMVEVLHKIMDKLEKTAGRVFEKFSSKKARQEFDCPRSIVGAGLPNLSARIKTRAFKNRHDFFEDAFEQLRYALLDWLEEIRKDEKRGPHHRDSIDEEGCPEPEAGKDYRRHAYRYSHRDGPMAFLNKPREKPGSPEQRKPVDWKDDGGKKDRRGELLKGHEEFDPAELVIGRREGKRENRMIKRILKVFPELSESSKKVLRPVFGLRLSRRKAAEFLGMPKSSFQDAYKKAIAELKDLVSGDGDQLA